jgi:hypothetical protein
MHPPITLLESSNDEEEMDAKWRSQVTRNKFIPKKFWTFRNQNQFGIQTQKLVLTFKLSIHKFALMFMYQFPFLILM